MDTSEAALIKEESQGSLGSPEVAIILSNNLPSDSDRDVSGENLWAGFHLALETDSPRKLDDTRPQRYRTDLRDPKTGISRD